MHRRTELVVHQVLRNWGSYFDSRWLLSPSYTGWAPILRSLWALRPYSALPPLLWSDRTGSLFLKNDIALTGEGWERNIPGVQMENVSYRMRSEVTRMPITARPPQQLKSFCPKFHFIRANFSNWLFYRVCTIRRHTVDEKRGTVTPVSLCGSECKYICIKTEVHLVQYMVTRNLSLFNGHMQVQGAASPSAILMISRSSDWR